MTFNKFLEQRGMHPSEWEIIPDKYLAHNEIVFGQIIMSDKDAELLESLFYERFPGFYIEISMNHNQCLYAMYYMLEDTINREIKAYFSEKVVMYSIITLIASVIIGAIILHFY